MAKRTLHWKKHAGSEDFAAALSFLSLICPQASARRLVHRLRNAPLTKGKAKDLLRASALPLLDQKESHVAEDLRRIHKGKPLAPVLLVRGDFAQGVPLVVADGYHRICAACHYDEDAPIECRMAGSGQRS